MLDPRTQKQSMTRFVPIRSLIAMATIATIAACSSVPPDNAALMQARSGLQSTQSNPQTSQFAPAELKQASDAVALAEAAWARRDSAAEVNHLAYLATQRVAIADETTRQKAAEADNAKAGADRDRLRLAARTGEADAATRAAETAQRATAVAQGRTETARQDTRDAEQRAAELERQVSDLKARKTERGLVITLGDVLFDNNRAELRPGAARSVDQLVVFLTQYPMRTARVEGFTDSVGSEASNQDLSDRRAAAVRSALVVRGVGAERVTTQGYGEAYPVADNDSAGGRQANRRVEIVLSDESGNITAR